MRKTLEFIKSTTISGVVIIVPIAVIIVVLWGIVKKILVVTAPLTVNMSVGGPLTKSIIAIIIVLVVLAIFFFIGGLLLKSYVGNSFKIWLGKHVLIHIPFYKTIQHVTNQLAGIERSNYPIAEVDLYGNNTRVLGVVTETLEDGRFMVYTPFSPMMSIGQLHIISKENIKIMDIPVKDGIEIITRIGFEAKDLYSKKQSPNHE